MKDLDQYPTYSRRDFFRRAAAVSALAYMRGEPGFAEELRREPPYLALKKFIEPGHDEFAEEKTAMQIRENLERALAAKQLPGCENWGEIRRARFYPLPEGIVRYEIASERHGKLFYRVGRWRVAADSGRIISISSIEEHAVSTSELYFRDVTAAVFENMPSFREQLVPGVPYWRARLDPASGIDIYGSNGIAVGDINGDGRDEIYVCQPGGLPNRLYQFGVDGLLRDITDAWGVGILDDTSAALFLDLRNSGRQDLVVLRSGGPVLFLNEGNRFAVHRDAFRFATTPRGGFTGMAAADFDRDGKLDLYLCSYVYFRSEAQYTYAVPYQDAQNGPPNFLFRNRLNPDGSGFFEDCTAETGMNENNNRFSFAPAWCDFDGDGWPDLYVANDFGRKNLYVNKSGHFRDRAKEAGVEDVGPGMSACWFDYDHDGRPDLYVANMWADAGQRVVADKKFTPAHAGKAEAEAYWRHTKGNSLFRNRGDGTFEETTLAQHVEFGRWAWSSGGHDLNNDGQPEIFITCGMLTNSSETDLMSFFWRQVVARSPVTAQPSGAYENGWNALNQFMREEYSWNGHEPNVLHVREGDRYFDHSGISGLDFADDSRAFAVTDFDGDGRPDILLKSRLGPQVRVLQNNWAGPNRSIAFRLRGTKSNRDAIGARIHVDGQTKWLEAGSGFLSQHSKNVLFGLGAAEAAKRVQITWPSGFEQAFLNLEAGKTYTITEGSQELVREVFRAQRKLPAQECQGNNELALADTWFLQPVPLPTKQQGPGLFVIKEATPQYEIFRRYLFDWRTRLKPPLPLLLNQNGQAVKVYAQVPSEAQWAADLARINDEAKLALPFAGDYIVPPSRDFFKFGAAFLWSGYSAEALPYLEEVLRQNPGNARVLVLVGQIHLNEDRLDQAETYFRRALEADKQSPEAAHGIGLITAKRGRLEEARGYLEQAIALRRDYVDAINDLGAVFVQEGKLNDAVAALQYGIRVAPDEDMLYLNLGRTYVQLGQTDKARQVMQQLLDRQPDNKTARHALEELNGR